MILTVLTGCKSNLTLLDKAQNKVLSNQQGKQIFEHLSMMRRRSPQFVKFINSKDTLYMIEKGYYYKDAPYVAYISAGDSVNIVATARYQVNSTSPTSESISLTFEPNNAESFF